MLLMSSIAYCQDTIYYKNGTIISSKVSEINQTQITYKKSNNLDGPNYIVNRNDISVIKYNNGSIEVFNTMDSAKVVNNNIVNTQQTNVYYDQSDYRYNQPVAIQPIIRTHWWSNWRIGWGNIANRGYYRSYRTHYHNSCGIRGFHGGGGGFHGGFHCGKH